MFNYYKQMFDFVKISVNDADFANSLLKNNLLEFSNAVNNSTGELDSIKRAEYQNLKFTVYHSSRVEISGSLHYYHNGGLHNHNDYTITDVIETIKDLETKFHLNSNLARIHNLEFGYNLVTPYAPCLFLTNLITYKSKPFYQTENIKEGNYYFSKASNQYLIKIYNKGYQFNQADNILRFEKKIKKMECLTKEPVYLSSLIDAEFINLCINELIKCFDELIITDRINIKELSKPQRKTVNFCNNPRNLATMTPKERHRHKTNFNDIIQQFGVNNLRSITKELLIKKGNDLTGVQNEKRERFDSSYIQSNHSFKQSSTCKEYRACQSCGKDISRQVKNSKFCSEKFVGYEQSHQCRNRASNPQNNRAKKIRSINSKGVLFSIEPFLKLSEQKKYNS